MKISKVLSIFVIATMLLVSLSNIAFAAVGFNPSTITPNIAGTGTIGNVGQSILGLIRIIGNLVAVAILIVLGIKYMMGSAEEKAEYKKTLMPYLIGAVLIFTASNVASLIYGWATTAITT